MKANWKWALMFAAAIMFVACKDKNKPVGPGGDDDDDPEFVSKISITDNSIADWDNLPANHVFTATCPEDAPLLGLKSIKVFADELYINILAEPVDDIIEDKSWVPFHIYLNVDNSDQTGGYGDEFADANADILLEGSLYSEGEPISYAPGVFKWWGEAGVNGWENWTDPSVEHSADDKWGAIIGEGELTGCASQFVDGKFEFQILRVMIPAGSASAWNANEFGIGFDIQQDWSSVGILPVVSPTEGNDSGFTKKMTVKIYRE